MKKFMNSKYGELVVYSAVAVLNLILTIIFYSVKMVGNYSGISIWRLETLGLNGDLPYFNVIFGLLFALYAFFTMLAVVIMVWKKKRWGYYLALLVGLVPSIALLFSDFIYKQLGVGSVFVIIIQVALSIGTLGLLIYRHAKYKALDDEAPGLTKCPLSYKITLLVCSLLVTIIFLATFFVPLYTESSVGGNTTYVISAALTSTSYPVYMYVIFIAMFVALFAGIMQFVNVVAYFFRDDKMYVKRASSYIYYNIALCFAVFLAGYIFTFIFNVRNKGTEHYVASTVSYIPLLCTLPIAIVFAIFQGKTAFALELREKARQGLRLRIEPLLFVFVLTVITFIAPVFNLIEVHMAFSNRTENLVLTGYKLMNSYKNVGAGFQTVAFMLYAVLTVCATLFVLTAVAFFSKNKDYPKFVKVAAVVNVLCMLLLGLFGVYFQIAQKVNQETLQSLIDDMLTGLGPIGESIDLNYTYDVKSKTIFAFVASVLVFAIMVMRGQFMTKAEEALVTLSDESSVSIKGAEGEDLSGADSAQIGAAAADQSDDDKRPEEKTADFDACPAFTELDAKADAYNEEMAKKRESLFENLTLPNLVRFVVDYARECRLHLSYTPEDIATFVAGLGASRLTILQGMSGTGKTSLPKIFAEAIMGNCEVVEVESSWRDKNELLGYYNEFSKCFTPKKFTQCLYKAALNNEVTTFIVLDEMNLSRIEYYFSDFLSLMEHEEDKREIKLLNVKLARIEGGERHEYLKLSEGHTIKIPRNVWFIGTANRDESTFAISDKVYDRAQTMNFNKRAPKVRAFGEPIDKRFVPFDMLIDLFDQAKSTFEFDAEDNATVQKVEKLLAPYNISFGNRILKQMEEFVKIYCSCFGDKTATLPEAVEKILLSKVVAKLESKMVENKEELAVKFDKLGLVMCSAFVRKLNED